MLGTLRMLCEQASGSYFHGEVTINDKDLYERALVSYQKVGKDLSYEEMMKMIFNLKRKRCIRLDCKFIGEDIYHAKVGDTVYHIKLLKNSMNY